MVNVERLQTELEFVTRNRVHHSQGLWFREPVDNACETTGCLAGWTVMHYAKDRLVSTVESVGYGDKAIEIRYYEPRDDDWTGLGAELLDLNWEIANELFHHSNTIWDLWNIANIISHGEIQIPEAVKAERYDRDQYHRTTDDDYADYLLVDLVD